MRGSVFVVAGALVCASWGHAVSQESLEVRTVGGETVRRLDARGDAEDTLPSARSTSAMVESSTVALADASVAVPPARAAAPRITIDRMTTASVFTHSNEPANSLALIGRADVYFLSDGSSWSSGAGGYQGGLATLRMVEMAGGTVRYHFDPPADGVVYAQTDFDSGDHSAQGSLGVDQPLVLEAEIGSTTAVMYGGVRVLSNPDTWYREPRFNFYNAIVGSVVPFALTYELQAGTWTETTFDGELSYRFTGEVDFADALSTPALLSVAIVGLAEVPQSSTVQYRALASYAGDVTKPVTAVAAWTVEPAGLATVTTGGVTVPAHDDAEALTLRVVYDELGQQAIDERPIPILNGPPGPGEKWGTFQGNARHSGYVPVSLEPEAFELRWERPVLPGEELNPVAAANGRVFVTPVVYFNDEALLLGLDARDGEVVWSQDFGDVFSVNPPAAAYGNVYVQTGNHGTATYLRAYDGATGAFVFQAPHSAQWERYFAPTIVDGTVYVNGGGSGGAYAFDASSGDERWFLNLPQYDQWTPAVDDTRVYAYVGRNSPGVYVADRVTGELEFQIPDANFRWNGWSMGLAPVLGNAQNLLAIQGGRLISFDLDGQTVGWELDLGFVGQPSVRRGEIYASVLDGLVILDETTGALQWSWTPPNGEQIDEPMVVTDSHVLVSTNAQVHAVSRLSRVSEWTYPLAGKIALGDGAIFIASETGTVAAVDLGGFEPSPPVRVEIVGPASVVEFSSTQYTARVTYADGRVRDRTPVAAWAVETDAASTLGADGVLELGELLMPRQDATLSITYTELGVTVAGTLQIALGIGVGLQAFVERNLATALAIQQRVVADLVEAMVREEAVRAVLRDPTSELAATSGQARRAYSLTKRAIGRARRAIRAIEQGRASVAGALEAVSGP